MSAADEQRDSRNILERTKSIEGSDGGHGSSPESKTKKGATKSVTRIRSKSVSSASAAGAWLMGKSWSRQSVPAVPVIASTSAASKTGSSQGERFSLHHQHRSSTHTDLSAGLNVSFVAEYQDNLNAVTLLLKINNPDKKASPPKQLTIEVVPTTGARADPSTPSETGDRILVKHKANWSTPLFLPTPVLLGKFTVECSGEHYEIKLATPTASNPTAGVVSQSDTGANENATATLDAAHLTSIAPSSFICASCSLPFVQSSNASTAKPQSPFADSVEAEAEGLGGLNYRDLPSEHWAELLDAWMCHHDQKLADRIAQTAKEGFWPAKGECLVGGSYLLLEEGSVVVMNLRETDAKVGLRFPFPFPCWCWCWCQCWAWAFATDVKKASAGIPSTSGLLSVFFVTVVLTRSPV
jgi:ubiquitin-protein ligase E3 D